MSRRTALLPNTLTIFRIILVLPLMICLSIPALPARIAAIICFVAASLTDFIDGHLARKHHQVTDLGAFLDPLADKMLINLTFLVLVYINMVPLWIFAVILVRDFAVDGVRMMAARQGRTLAAAKSGKLKTIAQMFTITLILLNLILQNPILTTVCDALLYIVVILTVVSGIEVGSRGLK